MEWTVNEDSQWRQLGSIVNAVLSDTRAKAVRKGMLSPASREMQASRIARQPMAAQQRSLGLGFLSPEAAPQARAVQLELPFGIGAGAQTGHSAAQAPRGIRLM
jgi:hypothetical protein